MILWEYFKENGVDFFSTIGDINFWSWIDFQSTCKAWIGPLLLEFSK
jgi:hypothetical protein